MSQKYYVLGLGGKIISITEMAKWLIGKASIEMKSIRLHSRASSIILVVLGLTYSCSIKSRAPTVNFDRACPRSQFHDDYMINLILLRPCLHSIIDVVQSPNNYSRLTVPCRALRRLIVRADAIFNSVNKQHFASNHGGISSRQLIVTYRSP